MGLEEDALLLSQQMRAVVPLYPSVCKRAVIEMFKINPNYRPAKGTVFLDDFMGLGLRMELTHYWIVDMSDGRRADFLAHQFNGHFHGDSYPEVFMWLPGQNPLYRDEHILSDDEINEELYYQQVDWASYTAMREI